MSSASSEGTSGGAQASGAIASDSMGAFSTGRTQATGEAVSVAACLLVSHWLTCLAAWPFCSTASQPALPPPHKKAFNNKLDGRAKTVQSQFGAALDTDGAFAFDSGVSIAEGNRFATAYGTGASAVGAGKVVATSECPRRLPAGSAGSAALLSNRLPTTRPTASACRCAPLKPPQTLAAPAPPTGRWATDTARPSASSR